MALEFFWGGDFWVFLALSFFETGKKKACFTVCSCGSPARRGHWRVPKPENWIVWAGGLSTGRVAAGIMRPAAQTATPMTMTANWRIQLRFKINKFLCYLLNSHDIEAFLTNALIDNKRPTRQLRQSDNICNVIFFPPKGNNNRHNFEDFSPKDSFYLVISAAYLRAPIKISST